MCTAQCMRFASVENSAMSVTKKDLGKQRQLFSKRKVAKLFGNVGNQLFNKVNISGIFLLLLSQKLLGK